MVLPDTAKHSTATQSPHSPTRSPNPLSTPKLCPEECSLFVVIEFGLGSPLIFTEDPVALEGFLHNWKKDSESKGEKRSYTDYDESCDPKLYNWNKPKRVAVSLFLPWVAAAKAIGETNRLWGWPSRQANTASAALSDLLKDEETTRHASLQNCAAINFLLLAHGYGCQDFEGMCSFNLSSHTTSIHINIQKLHELMKDLKVETTPDWVHYLFGQWGLTRWALALVKGILWILIVIVIVLVTFACLVQCFKKITGSAYLVNTDRNCRGYGFP